MSNPSPKVQTLSLKQFTAFSEATFKFSPDINVIIGENATGKTHLMKIIYTLLKACENTHQRQISSNDDKFKKVFHSRLHSIFQIHHPKALTRLGAERTEVLMDYANTHFHLKTDKNDFSIQYEQAQLPNPSSLIYLPAREFLSIFEAFIKAYNKRELPFDETYYDLALGFSLKRATLA
jgi:predicted ATP-binding protein involved in virulence